MSKPIEPLPCPFCGRTPVVVRVLNEYFVGCKCGIAQDKLYSQRGVAVRAWNKRKEKNYEHER